MQFRSNRVHLCRGGTKCCRIRSLHVSAWRGQGKTMKGTTASKADILGGDAQATSPKGLGRDAFVVLPVPGSYYEAEA